MDILQNLWQLFLHFDQYLDVLIPRFGWATYGLAAFVIFAEVGLVVTGFLPGDSLLFAMGALSARGTLNLPVMLPLLCVAAFLGNISCYQIGWFLSPFLEKRKKIRFFSTDHLTTAHRFFDRFGRTAVILARFLPLIRSFVPLAAGISRMEFGPYVSYSLLGCCTWVSGYLLAGFFFGNIPFVKNNFMMVVLGIVVISMLPALVKLAGSLLKK
ncbi:MAG: Inner membrane protein YqjA [bacterium ADurb.Bin478]|nr:MAG: Inner membrane protein YqjA [bacterium ADurb.Bin478]